MTLVTGTLPFPEVEAELWEWPLCRGARLLWGPPESRPRLLPSLGSYFNAESHSRGDPRVGEEQGLVPATRGSAGVPSQSRGIPRPFWPMRLDPREHFLASDSHLHQGEEPQGGAEHLLLSRPRPCPSSARPSAGSGDDLRERTQVQAAQGEHGPCWAPPGGKGGQGGARPGWLGQCPSPPTLTWRGRGPGVGACMCGNHTRALSSRLSFSRPPAPAGRRQRTWPRA